MISLVIRLLSCAVCCGQPAPSICAGWAEAEPGLLAAIAGRDTSGWGITGIDPDGCDLRRESETFRLDFPTVVESPANALAAFAALTLP